MDRRSGLSQVGGGLLQRVSSGIRQLQIGVRMPDWFASIPRSTEAMLVTAAVLLPQHRYFAALDGDSRVLARA